MTMKANDINPSAQPNTYVTSSLLTYIVYLESSLKTYFHESSGLPLSHYRILMAIQRLNNHSSAAELAEMLDLSPVFVCDSIKDLVRQGLITQECCESDRRRKNLSLTQLGKEIGNSGTEVLVSYFRQLWKPIGHEHINANVQGALALDDIHKTGIPRRNVGFVPVYIEVPCYTMNVIEDTLKSSGLTVGQYRMLLELNERGGESRNKDLGIELMMRPNMLTETVKPLVQNGMAVREEHPCTSSITLTITDKGYETLAPLNNKMNWALTNTVYPTSQQDQELFLQEAALICSNARTQWVMS